MFQANYSNENGETLEWIFQADNWQEAGITAESEEDDEWTLNSIIRLVW